MLLTGITLLILIIFSAFFSGAEIAFMSLSDMKVRHLVKKKARNARLVESLKSDPNRLLITVLIGNNLANIGSASLATTFFADVLVALNVTNASLSMSVGITTFVMTLLILVFGEIAPKTYCVHHAVSVSQTISPIIKLFQWIFRPVYVVINYIISKTAKDYFSKRYHTITEDEVMTMVTMSKEEGAIKQEERDLIHNVFELDNTEVGTVMTPRMDMFILEESITIDKALKKVQDLEYSRIPIYKERIDKITGIVHTKDILRAAINDRGNDKLSSLANKAIFVPESMMVNVLLEKLKEEKTHLVMVVDEHGGIAGLVSFEDILEELVGEIYDETDKPEDLITPIDERSFKVLGKVNIQELNSELKLTIKEDESYDTISGLVLAKLGYIPEQGEKLEVDGLFMVVSKVEENRILEVVIKTSLQKKSKKSNY